MQVKGKHTNRRLAEYDVALICAMADSDIRDLSKVIEAYRKLVSSRKDRLPGVFNWLARNLDKELRRRTVELAEPGLWELDAGTFAECPVELGRNLVHLYRFLAYQTHSEPVVNLLTEIVGDLTYCAKVRLEHFARLQTEIEFQGK
jgi:hypothetical protein